MTDIKKITTAPRRCVTGEAPDQRRRDAPRRLPPQQQQPLAARRDDAPRPAARRSRNAARERAAKVFVERSVAAAPNPVTASELAEMKKELETAGADLVVPRASEEEGFQIAVEKA